MLFADVRDESFTDGQITSVGKYRMTYGTTLFAATFYKVG